MNNAARPSMMLITVAKTLGSAPREAGTWMVVSEDHTQGTLGGGHVEYQAIAYARELLAAAAPPLAPGADMQSLTAPQTRRFTLGPALGQCCGGVMELRFELLSQAQLQALKVSKVQGAQPIALFGGGHVGRAIVSVLSNLPYQVTWLDSRDNIFPQQRPSNVECEHSDPIHDAVASLAPQSRVLIMSFSHAEDFDILHRCLLRQRQAGDLPYIGLIGSKTKWASFQSRLRARGLTQAELDYVTCPIGIASVQGKEPEVIAIAVAAQLLSLERPHLRC